MQHREIITAFAFTQGKPKAMAVWQQEMPSNYQPQKLKTKVQLILMERRLSINFSIDLKKPKLLSATHPWNQAPRGSV